MNVLGMMSGSSLDGLDMALCSFEYTEGSELIWDIKHTQAVDFPPEIKEGLSRCSQMSVRELKKLEVQFSDFCAQAINGLNLTDRIDYVASHGHTVIHHPEDGFTVQIGSGAIIAERTGLPCICDFRSNDMALGGQGAPVAPIVEQLVLKGYNYYINIGGIANVSVHTDTEVISWDSVPCNQVLNHYAKLLGKSYDDKGQMASEGRLHNGLMKAWLALPYFSKPHPKSLDNNWVQGDFMSVVKKFSPEPKDALRAMVEVCATQLAHDMSSVDSSESYTRKCLITGGGAHNDFLVKRLSDLLGEHQIEIVKPSSQIIDYKEAVLMALMGYLRVELKENTISTVTGASYNTMGGCIYRSGRELK